MKKVFFLIMMTIMVVGCQEEEIINSNETLNKETFQKDEIVGMLNFKSFDELNSFIEKNEGADIIDLAKSYSEERHYNPLLLVYNLKTQKEDTPDVNTKSGLLLLLLNEKGEISIDGNIFRIDSEFVYAFSTNDNDDKRSETVATFLKEYNTGRIVFPKEKSIEYDNVIIYHHENNSEIKNKNASARTFNTDTTIINSTTTLRGVGAEEYWFFISFVWFSTNVEYNSVFPDNINMFVNSVSSNNRLNYDIGIDTNYITAPWLPSNTGYFGDDVYETTRLLWRLPKFSVGFPAPERYTITLGGSLHQTDWGTSPTGSNYDVFISY